MNNINFSRTKHHTVLFVDDEKNILNLLSLLLNNENYKVLTANSGQEALSLLETNQVQLIIADQKMPNMTGIDFFQKVKEKYPETVRIILSAFIQLNEILDSINKGEIYRYIIKPWKTGELKYTIQQCFDFYETTQKKSRLTKELLEKNQQLIDFNKQLENLIEERTQTMKLAIQILKMFPLPFLGLDSDKKIILANGQLIKNFAYTNSERLPEWIHSEIEKICAKNINSKEIIKKINAETYNISFKIVKHLENIKGFILLFKEINNE